ncbi:MAG: sulfur carrier protein ThiS [Bacteroidetes bacterium]|nr:sulfur carrier protein ThiS [Bacteroidota bacterium]HET6243866.1 sulfur carrier protein ThiS [Bacteroidia bacterium]
MILINGVSFNLGSEKNLALLFEQFNIDTPKGIAVAVNNKVISRTSWKELQIKENDTIIIIKATQGG